jgi:hypothetical protein
MEYSSANVQSNQYCMTFTVTEESVPTCPGELETTVYVLKIDLHRLMIKNCI